MLDWTEARGSDDGVLIEELIIGVGYVAVIFIWRLHLARNREWAGALGGLQMIFSKS